MSEQPVTNKRIVALVDAPRFREAITTAGQALGYEVEFMDGASAANAIPFLVDSQPVLILISLAQPAAQWQSWVRAVKTSPATRRIPVLAFGAQDGDATTEQARQYGCDAVVTGESLQANAVSLIQTYARDAARDRAELLRQCVLPPPDLLLKGIAEFNAGAYFEQHETLESAWRAETGPIRLMYQGILQIGVAYYHIQRRNYTGALKLFQRARQYLDPLPDVCQGVDIAGLRADARAVQSELERLGPDRIAQFNPVLLKPVRLAM